MSQSTICSVIRYCGGKGHAENCSNGICRGVAPWFCYQKSCSEVIRAGLPTGLAIVFLSENIPKIAPGGFATVLLAKILPKTDSGGLPRGFAMVFTI